MIGVSWAGKIQEFECSKDWFILSARWIIRSPKEQIAILFDKRFNLYCTPGGKIDKGENILEGLKRELDEELKLIITNSQLIISKKILSQYWAFLQSTFLIDIEWDPIICEPDKLDRIEYVDVKDWNNLLWFSAFIGSVPFEDEWVLYDSLLTYHNRNNFPVELQNWDFPFNFPSVESISENDYYILYFDPILKQYFNVVEKDYIPENNIILYKQKWSHLKKWITKVYG